MAIADIMTQLPSSFGSLPAWLVLVVVAWTLTWKGIALWKSARLSQPIWFVVLLVVNTLGILEILYIFVFSEMKFNHLALRKSRKSRR